MNIKKALYILIFSLVAPLSAYQYNLAICSMFQNEARFLKEWIEFYKLIGVEHFYLYNNYSTDNYLEILQPYIDAGIVELLNWPYSHEGFDENEVLIPTTANQTLAEQHCANSIPGRIRGKAQVLANNHCLDNVRSKVKWLMLIDIDEFLFPVKCDNLQEFLKDYEEFGAVCAPFIMFGTSDVNRIPDDKLLIESLTMQELILENTFNFVKSIVRPERIKAFHIHHATEFYGNYFQVNPDKIKFEGRILQVKTTTNKLRINHYWTRDNEFLNNTKIARQYFFSKILTPKWVLARAASMNIKENLTIQKYVSRLKEKVFDTK